MIIKKVFPLVLSILMLMSIGAAAASNSVSYNTGQISQTAVDVKKTIETKNNLPNIVTIGNSKVTNSQFLYLLTTATKNVHDNNKASIKIKKVSTPASPSETLKSGTLSESQYLSIANSINSYINANGKIPNYVKTPLGNMKYQSMIYMYSKIMSYYHVNKKLPSSVSVKSWFSQTLGKPAVLNGTAKFTSTLLGKNSYGYVLKIGSFGTGQNKVAIIIGVHPLEVQTHIAMLNAIEALSKSLNNVQIWVYSVVVYNGADYNAGRTAGQNLANKYVVPNIGTSYKLVMDTHGNTGNGAELYSGYPNFVFAPVQNTKSLSFANKLINSKYTNGDLINHPIAGTSPKYVTIPIANKGIPTLVYEQYINQTNYAQVLYMHALQILKAINAAFA